MPSDPHLRCNRNVPAPLSLDSPSRGVLQCRGDSPSRVGLPYRVNPNRRAAVLICVMVLLLITGLIMHQTLQALLLVRRGDARHFELRQARELVELGKMVVERQQSEAASGETPAENTEIVDDRVTRPMQQPLIVSLATETSGDTTVRGLQGSLLIESLSPQGESNHNEPSIWKITVRYPLGNNNEFTVTEELAHAESP